MILIQIGGLGFLVWEDISNCVGSAIREKTSIKEIIFLNNMSQIAYNL